ncbi:MAG TPA: class I SAM-dependent methyltransferase [Solimonas sp.]
MPDDRATRLKDSWIHNAAGWTAAVREGRIESRRLVTDAAILAAIRRHRPARLLDLGCGEGWLCRAATAEGIEATGIDASAPLIQAAQAAAGAQYHVMSYDQLDPAVLGRHDLLVCNFALLDDRLPALLQRLQALRTPSGRLLIQTLHPGDAAGQGWREERFEAFGGGFPAAMPWYFRSRDAWLSALRDAGWGDIVITEPIHPHTGARASLLLDAGPTETPA